MYATNLNSSDFSKTVSFLCRTFNIEEIIETGTFNGQGSTSIFAETKLPVTSLEANSELAASARKHLANYSNVKILNVLSLKKQDMKDFIAQDNFKFPDWVLHDVNDSSNEKDFYTKEISQETDREDVLKELIDNDKSQLIFLDSAGAVGYLEFKEVLKLDKDKLSRKTLLMDDVFHIKHYRSIKELSQMGNCIPFLNSEARFAWYKF